ncbi:COMM domain-containing protein 9 [Bagarius yarrelli]|uniref:COMM domain-containing protein 9 n=1 Tax=Bagarius yarrelli TaxID=175774 RepID=A0A556TI65_BAGYA|nr:COMM domain-containing protein 9 [Bagarius yarrelli]
MAPVTEEHFSSLQLLLKAPSKDVVRQICKDSFSSKVYDSQHLVDSTARALSVSSPEAMQRQNKSSPFSQQHSTQTSKILSPRSSWNKVSLPRLADLEWRVDMKLASDSVSRMAVPTCMLNMKIQDEGNISGGGGSTNESSVTVELSKETLETMLDGLGRIRDQLSAVAGK